MIDAVLASRCACLVWLLALLTLLTLADPGAATEARDLATLFPEQATVAAPAGRFARLELPAAVLAASRPDLSDVRLFDDRGEVVPYAIDRGEAAVDELEVVRSAELTLAAASQRTALREDGPPRYIERYELEVPAAARDAGPWQLVVRTRKPRFVRQASLTAGDQPPVAGSIFRLDAPPRERLRLAVGDLSALGESRLVLSLEGEDGGYLEPDFRLQHVRQVAGRDRAEIVLEASGRESSDGRTTVVVERPAGLVPDLLRLRTTTPALARDVAVWDEGPNRVENALGRGRVARSPGEQADETLSIPIAGARGDRLRIVIDDGDSPPLEALEIVAVARMPALVFVLPGEPETEATATLRFGGGHARRPRFDALALDAAADGPAASDAEALRRGRYDPDRVVQARLGEIAANPAYRPAPAFALTRAAGAAVDARRLRHRRAFSAPASRHGLVRVPLELADLAAARADLGDLRVVDTEGKQRPYLLVRDRHVWQDLGISAPRTAQGESSYRLTWPHTPLAIEQLAFTSPAPFFDRRFTLRGVTEGDEEVAIARGDMRRSVGDPRPWRVDLPATRLSALSLRVTDGDDAPLVFDRVAGRFEVADLYLPLEAGDYSLLLGDADAASPRYELESLRSLVLALDAADAVPGQLEANPAYRPFNRLAGARGLQTAALWLVIGVVAVFLGWLTLRSAR